MQTNNLCSKEKHKKKLKNGCQLSTGQYNIPMAGGKIIAI